jgi:nuclear pore complex protein Nup155
MRPVPGAFMHTPAVASRFGTNADPLRRRLFGDTSNHPTGGPRPGFGDSGLDAPTGPQQALQPLGQPIGGTGAGQPLATIAAAASPQSPLAKAASYVNNSLVMDRQYPELEQYCKRESTRRYLVKTVS